jgi:hypothetical protein
MESSSKPIVMTPGGETPMDDDLYTKIEKRLDALFAA